MSRHPSRVTISRSPFGPRTIKEVAEDAKVDPSHLSRYLRGLVGMSPEAKSRVEHAADLEPDSLDSLVRNYRPKSNNPSRDSAIYDIYCNDSNSTLRNLGKTLNISHERVRQIIKQEELRRSSLNQSTSKE